MHICQWAYLLSIASKYDSVLVWDLSVPRPKWTYSCPQQHHVTVPDRSSDAGRFHTPLWHPVEEEEEKPTGADHAQRHDSKLPATQVIAINLLPGHSDHRVSYCRTLKRIKCRGVSKMAITVLSHNCKCFSQSVIYFYILFLTRLWSKLYF